VLDDVDLLVDGGPLPGVPSTIVRIAGDSVSVLRQGAIRVGKAPLDGPGTGS
jgi:tRNA A37 threonylcarbamoyladenosine synthetase subunit TsaC/SUA5/YrdC